MKAIFLDLDGTLMDSKPGIESSLRHAFLESGHDELAASDLTWMIGPPFHESFARAGIEESEKVISLYRAHYQASGMFTRQLQSLGNGPGGSVTVTLDRRAPPRSSR